MKKIWLAIVLVLLTGCGGKSAFQQTMDYNKEVTEGGNNRFIEILTITSQRDGKILEILKDNPTAAMAYAFIANERDKAIAQMYQPRTVRVAPTSGELLAQAGPSLMSTLVTGALGWKGLDTLGMMLDRMGSQYYLDAGGNIQLQDVGNDWNIPITGDGNYFGVDGSSFTDNEPMPVEFE